MTPAPGSDRSGLPHSDNPSVAFALVMLETRYPSPPHEIRLEEPKVKLNLEDARISGLINGYMLPDIAVYLNKKLIAVVEVGDLSREDKLGLLERYLPGVAVWWIPKTDIQCAKNPDMARFRLIVDIDALVIEGNKLLAGMSKQREELAGLMREFEKARAVLQEIPKTLRTTATMFEKISKRMRQGGP